MPQDDPPREADDWACEIVSTLAMLMETRPPAVARDMLLVNARWRLAAWIVADLEPTMEMKRVVLTNGGHVALGYAMAALPDMLAAARAEEARDG